MTPQDLKILCNALPSEDTGTLTFVPSEESNAVHDRMARFCDALQTAVPHVRVKKDSDTTFQAPALVVGRHGNIAYRSIPEGKMIQRFADALAQGKAATLLADQQILEQVEQLQLPLHLKLYIAIQCPHCPDTLAQIQALAGVSTKIRLTVIDAALFPEAAQTDAVRSVPTVIMDDQFRWSGGIDLGELISVGLERDPAQLSALSVRHLIEEGAAEMVAQMMVDNGKIFPALVELLAHERWSVRLGAMVTVEYLVEEAPGLASELVEPLWHGIADASPQAQGDMVHVLGQIPTQEAQNYLKRVADGGYDPVVISAALEALEDRQQ